MHENFFGNAATKQHADLVEHEFFVVAVAVLRGQAHRHAQRTAARDDGDFVDRVALGQQLANQRVARLVVGGVAVPQVLSFLELQAQALYGLGVEKTRIVLDPGIGFGKTVAQNFALLARQRELLALGYPLLAGWSRKSSLGAVTGLAVGERLLPSVAAAVLAAERGARVLRVHDVRATVQALVVWQAMADADADADADTNANANAADKLENP